MKHGIFHNLWLMMNLIIQLLLYYIYYSHTYSKYFTLCIKYVQIYMHHYYSNTFTYGIIMLFMTHIHNLFPLKHIKVTFQLMTFNDTPIIKPVL